jgi:hypothetical protein
VTEVKPHTNTSRRWLAGAVALLLGFGLYHAGADSVTAGTPRILSGTFRGFGNDGQTLAFQQAGSSTGTSFAWSGSTVWFDANDGIHWGGPGGCTSPQFIGHKITIGVVETKQTGGLPAFWVLAFVKCPQV